VPAIRTNLRDRNDWKSPAIRAKIKDNFNRLRAGEVVAKPVGEGEPLPTLFPEDALLLKVVREWRTLSVKRPDWRKRSLPLDPFIFGEQAAKMTTEPLYQGRVVRTEAVDGRLVGFEAGLDEPGDQYVSVFKDVSYEIPSTSGSQLVGRHSGEIDTFEGNSHLLVPEAVGKTTEFLTDQQQTLSRIAAAEVLYLAGEFEEVYWQRTGGS